VDIYPVTLQCATSLPIFLWAFTLQL
jgi:hypothetical protein